MPADVGPDSDTDLFDAKACSFPDLRGCQPSRPVAKLDIGRVASLLSEPGCGLNGEGGSMSAAAVDTARLSMLWDERWPGCPKLQHVHDGVSLPGPGTGKSADRRFGVRLNRVWARGESTKERA
jgi:hypothetical protein